MFKQRKVKGSIKQKKVENSDSDGDGEGEIKETQEKSTENGRESNNKKHNSNKSSKKSTAPVMSFGDDELMDEDIDVFKVKKSRLSKTIKRKIHQDPLLPEQLHQQDEVQLASSGSNASDYLSSLRQEQNYSVRQAPQTGLEGMELTGEEAESMEDLTESLAHRAAAQNTGSSSTSLPDYIPLTANSKQRSSHELGLHSSLHEESSHEMDVDEEAMQDEQQQQQQQQQQREEDDWEEQLARRAGVQVQPPAARSSSRLPHPSASAAATAGRVGQASATPSEQLLHMLSYQAVQRTLRAQISGLADRGEQADARLRSLDSGLEAHRLEALSLQAVVDKKSGQVEFLQHLRLFASDVCGMLREKQALIEELQAAVLQHLTAQATRRFQHWKQRQDRILDHMREAGDVITLGGYLPAPHPADSPSSSSSSSSFPSLAEECLETFAAEAELQATMHIFHSAAAALMQDVRPDLAALPSVLQPFQDFRRDHFAKYRDAYVSMSLCEIVKLYVLLDIVPLYLLDSNEEDKFEVSKRPWVSAVFDFSVEDTSAFKENSAPSRNKATAGADDKQTSDSSGDDSTLLPRVVAEIVLPWFTEVLAVSLNPLSVTQMTTCRGILEQCRAFDLVERQVAPLCLAVLNTIVRWVGSICVPVIKMARPGEQTQRPPRVEPLAYGSTQFFVREQLDRLSLIMENLAMFCGVIAASALARVAWTALSSQGQGAMVKLLAGGVQAPGVLSRDEVENLVSCCRLCRAVRSLVLPSLSSSQSQSPSSLSCQRQQVRVSEELHIPVPCLAQLHSLVLPPAPSTLTSPSTCAGAGAGAGADSAAAELIFRRAALLKFLRQLPL